MDLLCNIQSTDSVSRIPDIARATRTDLCDVRNTYTVGDELPIHGESYDYPDDFDIIVLRDGVAIKIRNGKVSDIVTIDKYEYFGVPVVNGRGLEVLVNNQEEVQKFLDEYNASDDGTLRAFAAKWLRFETYRRITMNRR